MATFTAAVNRKKEWRYFQSAQLTFGKSQKDNIMLYYIIIYESNIII